MKVVLFFMLFPFGCMALAIVWATLEYYFGVIKPVRHEMDLGKCLTRADQIRKKILRARSVDHIRQVTSNLADFDRRYAPRLPEKELRPISSNLWGLADKRLLEIRELEKRRQEPVNLGEMTIDDLLDYPKQI